MNKRWILRRIDEKVSDNHEAMDTGLEYEKYLRKVGENQALKDLRDDIVEVPDEDADDTELEELPA